MVVCFSSPGHLHGGKSNSQPILDLHRSQDSGSQRRNHDFFSGSTSKILRVTLIGLIGVICTSLDQSQSRERQSRLHSRAEIRQPYQSTGTELEREGFPRGNLDAVTKRKRKELSRQKPLASTTSSYCWISDPRRRYIIPVKSSFGSKQQDTQT